MAIREIIKGLHLPAPIEIVASTKGRPISQILEAIDAGILIIGENYVQEAEEKFPAIGGKAKIHLIGHLQTNKAAKAARIFDMIQSVDSERIADEINRQCGKLHKSMDVLIEVNIAEEKNKTGCLLDDAAGLAGKISPHPWLRLRGLMTVGHATPDGEQVRPYFRKMKRLFETLKKDYPSMNTLSMGMSDSYKAAIEEGATMVRLGTILFGKR